ncbi:protein NRT1/ PTR FAMILY 5.12-like [Impatiens glandulifera]|uniref:protein NRT1/ PTR FAMILY 5.12-like n=1 Tax=Impatiens glandulifera TaxID=253017 RepID=UPI001FB164FC|nr:protein NRT1/ PTR FAMILY 5.12-like [Impatiens glandulifera]
MGMSGFNVSARKFHDIQVEAEQTKPPPKLGFCYCSIFRDSDPNFASGTCEYKGKYQSAKKEIEQEKKKWRPRMSRIVPTCLCFAVCGIVSAVGDTYFLQQAKTMNPKFWLLTIPINFFKKTYKGWQGKDGPKDKEKFGDLKGVGFARFLVAMGVSIICCTTAAIVEFCRLGVVQRNGLTDKPDENHKRGSSQLLAGIVSSPMKDEYLGHIVSAVSGIGTMGSSLCTFAVDVISKRIGKKGWFQDTLNESRLDYYYWMLAFLSALNFGFFFFINTVFKTWEPEQEEIRNQEDKKAI